MGPPATVSGRILLVGPDVSGPELDAILSAQPWKCARCQTPNGVLPRLRGTSDIDLLLLTPESALHSYTELCREVKFDARTAFVSVVFLLPPALMLSPHKATHRAEAFAAGADDCIQLPASPNEILLRLSNALRVKRATDSLEEATSVITSLANAVEGRDAYTRGHVERVSAYSVELGKRVECSPDELSALRMGGIVHDIGKVAVPDHILNKPGKLSDEEMAIVKRHPLVGFSILSPLRTFQTIRPIVRWHHERPNGTGYPDGLHGDDLPLLPRIVAVADFFDAISTDRPYRPAFSPEKCREIAISAAEKEELDPLLVTTLLEMLSESGAASAEASSEAPLPAS